MRPFGGAVRAGGRCQAAVAATARVHLGGRGAWSVPQQQQQHQQQRPRESHDSNSNSGSRMHFSSLRLSSHSSAASSSPSARTLLRWRSCVSRGAPARSSSFRSFHAAASAAKQQQKRKGATEKGRGKGGSTRRGGRAPGSAASAGTGLTGGEPAVAPSSGQPGDGVDNQLALDEDRVRVLEDALRAAAEEYDTLGAQRRLEDLKALGRADVQHYNVLLLLLSRVRDMEGFNALLDEMEKEGIAQDENTIRQRMAGAMIAGDSAQARLHLDSIPESERSLLDYTCVLEAIAADDSEEAAGMRVSNALEVMEELQAKGFTPDVMTYTAFIKLHASDGDFDRAQSWMGRLRSAGLMPIRDTFTALLMAYGSATERAAQMASPENPLPPAAEARKVLDEAVREGQDSVDLFNVMADIYATGDQLESAMEVIAEMEGRGYERNADTMAILLFGNVLRGDVEAGLKIVLKDMKKLGVKPDRDDFSLLVQGAIGQMDQALVERILKIAEEHGIVLSEDDFQQLDWDFSDDEDEGSDDDDDLGGSESDSDDGEIEFVDDEEGGRGKSPQ